MDKIELKVANREILGKKVKHLRRQGITPVHVFGHGIESLALQCDTKELERVLGRFVHQSKEHAFSLLHQPQNLLW